MTPLEAELAAQAAKAAKRRRANLKWRYGMTPEDFDVLLVAQGHACAVCLTPEPECAVPSGKRTGRAREPFRVAVDHDHVTGKVRGLCCMRCNHLLGHLEAIPRKRWRNVASRHLLDYLANPPAAKLNIGQRGHHTPANQRRDVNERHPRVA